MRDTNQRPHGEYENSLAALAGEARELGALSGLTGTPLAVRELFEPRLLAQAAARFGPPIAALAALEERISQLQGRRSAAEEQIAGYRQRREGPPATALPGWRRGLTVVALAGAAACILMSAGLAKPAWLGALGCLAAAALVNAAGFEQSAESFTRWFDYRRARWRRAWLSWRIGRLQYRRLCELDRQLLAKSWVEEQLRGLEAHYEAAWKLAQRVRPAASAVAA